MHQHILRWVVLCTLVCAVPSLAAPQTPQLGAIHFPTSGSPETQSHFLRGVAALHNFMCAEAAEAFQKAQRIDPTFAMAYCGEVMTSNTPLWGCTDSYHPLRVRRTLTASPAKLAGPLRCAALS